MCAHACACDCLCVWQWVDFCTKHPECVDFVAVSSGTSEKDWVRLQEIVSYQPIQRDSRASLAEVCTLPASAQVGARAAGLSPEDSLASNPTRDELIH